MTNYNELVYMRIFRDEGMYEISNKRDVLKWTMYLCVLLLIMSSCGSRKVLYNPKEVAHLSKQLKIDIKNDDPNMPLYAEVSTWLGVPYRYAGNSKRGTDCSGFVSVVFQSVYGIRLDRSSDGQARNNVHSVNKNNLKTGDLVFFRTARRSKKIDHVGIYLKDGYFIHASTSKGVIVSSLSENYYKRTWQKGGRVK